MRARESGQFCRQLVAAVRARESGQCCQLVAAVRARESGQCCRQLVVAVRAHESGQCRQLVVVVRARESGQCCCQLVVAVLCYAAKWQKIIWKLSGIIRDYIFTYWLRMLAYAVITHLVITFLEGALDAVKYDAYAL